MCKSAIVKPLSHERQYEELPRGFRSRQRALSL